VNLPSDGHSQERSWHRQHRTLALWLVVLLVGLGVSIAILVLTSVESRPRFPMVVWIVPGASAYQIRNVETATDAIPGVWGCSVHSQAQNYREAKNLLPRGEFATLTVATTPASYRCNLSSSNESTVIARLTPVAGFFRVSFPQVPKINP
jgi:hypothetical protein